MLVRSITYLCLFAFLTPVQSGDKEDPKVARKAVYQVLLDQVEAWNKGDLKGFMVGYHRSSELTFYSGGNIVKGWDAMLERYEKKYQGAGKEMGKLTFKDVDIELLSADSAVVRGRWQLTLTKESPGGLFTLIFRKTTDGWRIVHDHTSN
jgi:ketosteroid isomerase-like protein